METIPFERLMTLMGLTGDNLTKNIFKNLDYESLLKCRLVCQLWHDYLYENREYYFVRGLKELTYFEVEIAKEFLRKRFYDTIQGLTLTDDGSIEIPEDFKLIHLPLARRQGHRYWYDPNWQQRRNFEDLKIMMPNHERWKTLFQMVENGDSMGNIIFFFDFLRNDSSRCFYSTGRLYICYNNNKVFSPLEMILLSNSHGGFHNVCLKLLKVLVDLDTALEDLKGRSKALLFWATKSSVQALDVAFELYSKKTDQFPIDYHPLDFALRTRYIGVDGMLIFKKLSQFYIDLPKDWKRFNNWELKCISILSPAIVENDLLLVKTFGPEIDVSMPKGKEIVYQAGRSDSIEIFEVFFDLVKSNDLTYLGKSGQHDEELNRVYQSFKDNSFRKNTNKRRKLK